MVIVQKHENSHCYNDNVTDKAVNIGNFPEKKNAQQGRKNNLRIIIHTDFSGRCMTISSRNTELTARCR